MRPSAMDVDIEFLRGYLEEEFSSIGETRIQIVLPASTQRSIDLEQDYDPNANVLHSQRGVRVILKGREFFFPANWVKNQMALVRDQVRQMRKTIGME